MRIAGFVFALLGALAAGALGSVWLSDAAKYKHQLAQAQALGLDVGSIVTAAYVLLVSVVLGIAGGVLTLRRKGTVAAAILIAAGVAPALFQPKALVFTWLLLLAGLLSLGARPRRSVAMAS